MSPSRTVPRAQPPFLTLADARLRANPRLSMLAFSALAGEERATFGEMAADPALFGVLRDERGAVKVVDHDSAALFESLREVDRVPDRFQADERSLSRLLLDGVIELEIAGGEFVSGSSAYELLRPLGEAPTPTTKTARLSQAALRHAEQLEVDDALRLSARLYFYGRLPLAPSWLEHLPTRAALARFLGIEPSGPHARRLRHSWQAVELAPPNDGWFLWSSRSARTKQDRFKLYVSPLPQAVPTAFSAALDVAEEVGAVALKVGNDAASLCRPDKLILYFGSFELVAAAAGRLAKALAACPGQGVPFTAEIAESDGLLSWGVDPPRSQHLLGWLERESWRLWLTNRLALALLAARHGGGAVEPWRYALARIELDGVDPATWAPEGDLWEEVA